MRRFLLVVAALSLLLVAGCAGSPAQHQRSNPNWNRLATLEGSAVGANGALQAYGTASVPVTMADEPARLALRVSAVYGRGTAIYLVPRSWIDTQPTNYSDFTIYPMDFLVATADTTGTTTIALKRNAGAYVLTGPAAGGSGSNFTAVLEQEKGGP